MSEIIKYTDEDIRGFFIGSYFGDGCFVKKSKTHNTYVVFKHCESQKMYLEWKHGFLKRFWLVKPNSSIKEKKLMGCYDNAQRQYGFASKTCEELNKFKLEPKTELMKDFNEMALSIYALDDGGFYNHMCKISCGTLSDEEKNMLKDVLLNKMSIECKIYNHKTNPTKDYFVFSGSDYDKLINIILSKIPSDIDIVKNKINREV